MPTSYDTTNDPKLNRCPTCNKPLTLSDMLYIEVCHEHQYAYDVFHGVQVDWGWYADAGDPDDYDNDEYTDNPRERVDCKYCGGDGLIDDITPCPHCDGEGFEWWLD